MNAPTIDISAIPAAKINKAKRPVVVLDNLAMMSPDIGLVDLHLIFVASAYSYYIHNQIIDKLYNAFSFIALALFFESSITSKACCCKNLSSSVSGSSVIPCGLE